MLKCDAEVLDQNNEITIFEEDNFSEKRPMHFYSTILVTFLVGSGHYRKLNQLLQSCTVVL